MTGSRLRQLRARVLVTLLAEKPPPVPGRRVQAAGWSKRRLRQEIEATSLELDELLRKMRGEKLVDNSPVFVRLTDEGKLMGYGHKGETPPADLLEAVKTPAAPAPQLDHGPPLSSPTLLPSSRRMLDAMDPGASYSAVTLARAANTTDKTAGKHLKRLAEWGYVVRRGPARGPGVGWVRLPLHPDDRVDLGPVPNIDPEEHSVSAPRRYQAPPKASPRPKAPPKAKKPPAAKPAPAAPEPEPLWEPPADAHLDDEPVLPPAADAHVAADPGADDEPETWPLLRLRGFRQVKAEVFAREETGDLVVAIAGELVLIGPDMRSRR